jgi:glycosyltransferase involved in cell wall biosynthesis
MDVADWLGRRKYIPKQIVSHEHPANRHNTNDQQYRHTEKFFNTDKQTYLKRKAENFGLPLLSVCICTIDGREKQFQYISEKVIDQMGDLLTNGVVEIGIYKDNKEISVGEKRNRLVNKSSGKFVVFIDDDDIISSDYLEQIFKAIETSPDVITFKGFMTTNGTDRYNFLLKLNVNYTTINKTHYRFPNHLCPMKRSLIKDVKFEHITLQEDIRWATKIRDLGLLKNDYHINNELYHYDFIKNK